MSDLYLVSLKIYLNPKLDRHQINVACSEFLIFKPRQSFTTLFFTILYSDDRSNNNNRIVCLPVDWGNKGMFCDHRNYDSDLTNYKIEIRIFRFDGTGNFEIIF